MTETRESYHVTRCSVCLTPVGVLTHGDGSTSTKPLSWSERKYDEFVAALKSERETTVRLAARIDALVIERNVAVDTLNFERETIVRLRTKLDSARKWAARWKRCAKRLSEAVAAACEKVYTPDVDAETADDLAEAIMALWAKQEIMVAALEYYADQTDDVDERMESWEHLPGPDTARETLKQCGFLAATPAAAVGGEEGGQSE